MLVFDKIKAKLSGFPDVRYSETSHSIEVHPTDEFGFTVGLHLSRMGVTVHFDGWHEEFGSEDEALECFAFGLSSSCRLAIVFRGNTATKWSVESLNEGQWIRDSTTGLMIQPFWRRARVVYRQNRLISAQ